MRNSERKQLLTNRSGNDSKRSSALSVNSSVSFTLESNVSEATHMKNPNQNPANKIIQKDRKLDTIH